MSFGKRAAQTAPRTFDAGTSPQHDALVAELRAMARAGGSKRKQQPATVTGRFVNEAGPSADPVLAEREGVADARDVRRSDYWASNLLGNASAIVGVAGGAALGFSPQGVIGFMFVIWGLTAAATGRMMKSDRVSSRVFMGRAARLAGLGIIATGAFFIFAGWSHPPVISHFLPDYEPPLSGLFGHQ